MYQITVTYFTTNFFISTNESLESENKALHDKLKAMNNNDDYDHLNAELVTLNEKVQQLSSQNAILETKLSNTEARLHEQFKRNETLESDYKELENEQNSKEEEFQELLDFETKELQTKIDNLESYIVTLEESKKSHTSSPTEPDFNQLKFQLEDALSQRDTQNEELMSKDLKIQALEQKTLEYMAACDKKSKAIESLQFELDEKATELLALNSPRNDLKSKIREIEATHTLRIEHYESVVTDLKKKVEKYKTKSKCKDSITNMAKNLTMELGDLNGSIIIDGEIPTQLANLLDEVHKEGVQVMKMSDKPKPKTIDQEAILKQLENLQNVLSTKESSPNMVEIFKEFEGKINSDHDTMITEIKSFVEKVSEEAEKPEKEMGSVLQRLENIASNLEVKRVSTPEHSCREQFVQVTPDKIVLRADHEILKQKLQLVEKRLAALQLAKNDEKIILEAIRQRVLASVSSTSIILTNPIQKIRELEFFFKNIFILSLFMKKPGLAICQENIQLL